MMKEIICSGIGGQGVLVAGNILADIAMEDGLNVSWYPSYGFEMRGGAANCELKIGEGDLIWISGHAAAFMAACSTLFPSMGRFGLIS